MLEKVIEVVMLFTPVCTGSQRATWYWYSTPWMVEEGVADRVTVMVAVKAASASTQKPFNPSNFPQYRYCPWALTWLGVACEK